MAVTVSVRTATLNEIFTVTSCATTLTPARVTGVPALSQEQRQRKQTVFSGPCPPDGETATGLAIGAMVTRVSGTAERRSGSGTGARHTGKYRITLGADKAYEVASFVESLRKRNVTPHMAVQDHLSKTGQRRKTKINGYTTRHAGYEISQHIRKLIEEIFGWAKVQAGQSKTKFIRQKRVVASFALAITAFNFIGLPKLLGANP